MDAGAKLQIKPGHSVALLHVPPTVSLDLPQGSAMTADAADADAVVVFAEDRVRLEERAGPFVEAARRDALAWVAYPKAGQLGTDLNRDSLWRLLAGEGIRPVRQVAIDDVWSALRFRPA
jgi:hypothetical protein